MRIVGAENGNYIVKMSPNEWENILNKQESESKGLTKEPDIPDCKDIIFIKTKNCFK